MDKKKLNKIDDADVHIEQINQKDKNLNDLEKTAIFQFLFEDEYTDDQESKDIEEELSRTQQLKILNAKRKKVVEEFELPKIVSKNVKKKNEEESLELPKRANNLSDTIRIKISDLRSAIEKKEKELETKQIEEVEVKKAEKKKEEPIKVETNEAPKKSLYDTIIIKLDDIINNRKALKSSSYLKVVKTTEPKFINEKKKKSARVKDITKDSSVIINVDSKEFVSQITNLNIIALKKLSSKKETTKVRNGSEFKKNHPFEKMKLRKEDYLAYRTELIEFAIDKLYYKYSLRESKKYKIYKFSVALSILVFIATSFVIGSWFIQGLSINNLSNTLVELAPVENVDDGTIINTEYIEDVPALEDGTLDKEVVRKNEMYWQYLNTPLSSVDFTELLKENEDTVGWLIVNNTNINYPVVQTTNNDYYLKHAFDKSKNYAGWVYADYRVNFNTLSKNNVIYAHGRKDGVMFGSLMNTLKENWYTNSSNQIIQLSTLKYNTMWQIFSIYKIEAESYYITTDFSTNKSFKEFADVMKSRSIYDFGVDIDETDKMLTLSTCYNDKGTRLVVQAKLVKIQTRQ